MPQRDGPRLEGRAGLIWTSYVGGATQAAIAAEHGISQQRVSQVLDEVRATVGDTARMDAALLAQERADALLSAVWADAMAGDVRAVTAALRVLERLARSLGTDAPEPVSVSLERRLDVESDVVVDAVVAAVEVLGLGEDSRVLALQAAQAKLLGEPAPEPAPPAAPAVEEPDLMEDFRRFAEREGFDPDGLGDDEDDDGDD